MLIVSPAGNQYLTGLTLYFIGYVLFEVGPFSAHENSAAADRCRYLAISY